MAQIRHNTPQHLLGEQAAIWQGSSNICQSLRENQWKHRKEAEKKKTLHGETLRESPASFQFKPIGKCVSFGFFFVAWISSKAMLLHTALNTALFTKGAMAVTPYMICVMQWQGRKINWIRIALSLFVFRMKKIEIVWLVIFWKEFRDLKWAILQLRQNLIRPLQRQRTLTDHFNEYTWCTYISMANHVTAIQCIPARGHEMTIFFGMCNILANNHF